MTYKEAREYFNYDQDTGELTWRVNGFKIKAGARAGCVGASGYIRVGFKYRDYLAHRIIWLYTYGYLPEHQIDHINRIPDDNRLVNLREVSASCNIRNSGIRSTNKSGITGISWNKRKSRWDVRIYIHPKIIHLGYHRDLTSAVKARHEAEVKHKWPGCNSSTPAYQYLVAEGIL